MKILFLTWKDIKHPFAGGAEKVMYEYSKWLIKLWHEVTWFAYSFKNSKETEIIDWIKIIRKFNLYSSFFLFPNYYKKYFAWKYDLIVDEAWWIPLLSPKFEKNIPIVFFVHHIWDKEWDYNYPFPLNKILKSSYYWLFKQYKNYKTITVSQSTKDELVERFLFKDKNIRVIENVCDITPVSEVNFSEKEKNILFLWRLMPIKRVEHAILAFSYFLKSDKNFSDYKLDVVWNDQDKRYVKSLKSLTKKLWIENNVNFLWHKNRTQYKDFIFKEKLILVPSIKEWFWLIVLEANSFWIPAIWYNVSGLKDSIKNNKNGFLIWDWNYEDMWKKIIEVLLKDDFYKQVSISSLDYVKSLDNWEWKVREFEEFILNF